MNDSADTASPEAADTDVSTDAPLEGERLALSIEAALMTADRPVPVGRLSDAFGKPGAKAVRDAIEGLNELYESTGRSFHVVEVAGGFQVRTRADFAEALEAMNSSRTQNRLSPAAMETLAIIAYRQPITRADIEAIRGVASGEIVRGLLERHLVRITGRADELGRPMLYGTTRGFLEVFGLGSLSDLPRAEELAAPAIRVGAQPADDKAPADDKPADDDTSDGDDESS